MSEWPQSDQERIDFVDWQYEVSNGDTVLGFRDWVSHRDESDSEDTGRLPSTHPYSGSVTRESNCTEGLMCPECGWTGRFIVIDARVTCTLVDDGVCEYEGCEYESDTQMRCGGCSHAGTVAEFTLPPAAAR